MAEDRITPEHIPEFEAQNLGLAKQYLEMAIRSGVEHEVEEILQRSVEAQRKD